MRLMNRAKFIAMRTPFDQNMAADVILLVGMARAETLCDTAARLHVSPVWLAEEEVRAAQDKKK